MWMQALRMTGRDWRAGELRFLLIALVVAVGAMSSVGFFVERLRTGLNRDAHQLLGGDLVVGADQAIETAWLQEARARGLQTAQTTVFASMAIAGEGETARSRLSAVKAVTPGYPLRGSMRISDQLKGPDHLTRLVPQAGTVWLDASLLSTLQVKLGDSLRLGEKTLRITQLIITEPDRGASFMSFAPRIMLAADDLAETKLIQYGSRVNYRLQIAGAPEAVRLFQDWLQQQITSRNVKGVRLESLESGRPEMRATLDRAEQFLALVSLLSALLAAVAVAMAARRFMERHLDACAMLRCLGMRQLQVMRLYLLEFLILGAVASLAGVALGFTAHFVLLEWLGTLVSNDLPAPGWTPLWQGMATGMLLLVGFALPPILQLANVPHNRVIRREQEPPKPLTLVTYGLGFLSFVALLLWQAGNLKLGLLTAAGFAAGLAVFTLCAWASLRGLRRVRGLIRHPTWRFAITALQRRPGATMLQVVALALGLMALLLLTVVRGDLITAWRSATPADAPNHFILNIQPDQKAGLETILRDSGVKAPNLYPMIRGRLLQINDTVVTGSSYADERAQRLVDREFNLSTMLTMPASNQITAGTWFDDRQPAASVEEGLAKTLNLKLGDQLIFDIAGQTVSAPITSLRKLEWGSMRVNFFVILNPASMRDMPHSWITAFHLPAGQENLENQLARDYPNLTVVDIGAILLQVQQVVDQVVTAVEFLFLFSLASGILVLYAALAASQDERTREAALLRALGATRKQLSQAQWIEFALVGALSGILAASGAAAIGWLLATLVFDFAWVFSPLVWVAGFVAGVGCAFIGGWLGLRKVLLQPPLQTLREA